MTRHLIAIALLLAAAPSARLQEDIYRDPGTKTIVQVAIICKDIEGLSRRWANLLGVPPPKITTTRPGREVKLTYRGRPSDGQVKLAFIRMGQVTLELMEPVGGNTSWRRHLDEHGQGVHHIGMQVTDLAKTVETFERLGIKEEHRGRYDKDNGTYVYLDSRKDLGVTVELLHSDPK